LSSIPKKFDWTATASLLVTIFSWSTVPLFLKFFTRYIDAWTANGIRYPFAALLLLPWVVQFYFKGQLTARVLRLAILPAVINFLGQVLWAWAPYFVEPGLLAFTVRLSVVWSVLGSFILFADERTLIKSRRFWVGLVLSLCGFFFMITAGKALPSGSKLTGILISLLYSVFGALYGLTVRRNMQAFDSRLSFGIIALYTALGTFVLMLFVGNYSVVWQLSPFLILMILLSAIIGIAIAHVFYYVAVKRIGVAIASSFNLISAFLTAIFSWILFQEILTAVQWAAGLLLISGAMLLLWAQEKVKKYREVHSQ
jgi:drug/metabolite transporter (DMT)-like permease